MWPKRAPAASQEYDPTGAYPMESRNGKVVGAWQQRVFAQRTPFARDYDFTQRPFRRYVYASGAHNVQLPSGFDHHRWLGIRYPYRGAGWVWGFATPIMPNQMRYTGAGHPPQGASTSQLQAIIDATIGRMPQNPAGTGPPGQFYGPDFDNPGTG